MVSRLNDTISKFNKTASDTQDKLDKNPFSETYQRPVHQLSDKRYGRPEAGSLTEKRGIKAGNHIGKEIGELCEWIDRCGEETENGMKTITFGYLFRIYIRVSNKVVGMLLRARKHGLVQFEGEMLYQGQDNEKVITLLKPLDEIRAALKHSGDPKHCLTFESKE